MTPEEQAAADAAAAKAAADAAALNKPKTLTPDEIKALLDELNVFKTDKQNDIAARQAAKAKAEQEAQKAMEAQGRYEDLYKATQAELEKLKSSAENFNATLQTLYDAEITGIDAAKQALIPALPLEEKLAWLKNAKAAGFFGTAVTAPGFKPASEGVVITSKKDLKTASEKAEFIFKNGSEAYLKLSA